MSSVRSSCSNGRSRLASNACEEDRSRPLRACCSPAAQATENIHAHTRTHTERDARHTQIARGINKRLPQERTAREKTNTRGHAERRHIHKSTREPKRTGREDSKLEEGWPMRSTAVGHLEPRGIIRTPGHDRSAARSEAPEEPAGKAAGGFRNASLAKLREKCP